MTHNNCRCALDPYANTKPAWMLVHAIHNAGAVAFGATVNALTPPAGDGAVGLLLMGTVIVLGLDGLPVIISLLRGAPSHSAPPGDGRAAADD